MKRELTCSKCGNKTFTVIWNFKTKKQELSLIMCHDGIGFQIDDAKVKCAKCGCLDLKVEKA